jgi:hypothetical protein
MPESGWIEEKIAELKEMIDWHRNAIGPQNADRLKGQIDEVFEAEKNRFLKIIEEASVKKVADNAQVTCFDCRGHGSKFVPSPVPGDPGQCKVVPCLTCNGFGVLIATELKRVEKWEPKKR